MSKGTTRSRYTKIARNIKIPTKKVKCSKCGGRGVLPSGFNCLICNKGK